MAAKQPGIWGIDVGQCAFKALRLELIDGKVAATAFDYIEYPKILTQPDADADQLTREALEKFLSRNSLKGDIVVIGVPGQSGLARFVKLPPVEEKKIADIVQFEAKQQIPFPLEEVNWDFQKIGSGVVTDGFAMETEIGLFAMKRDMIQRFLQHFIDVKIEVHVIQMAPLALCNYIAYDLLSNEKGEFEAAASKKTMSAAKGEDTTFKKRCVVVLDIGADNSNLVITDGDRIIWQRPIPVGGNHFTRALTKELKLTFAKAEHLKRNATKSPDLKRILSALRPVLNEFVAEVQRSLGYFTNTHRDAHVEYLMGLGNAFRLPGIQKYLSEKLQLDVRKLQKFEHLTGATVSAAPAFTTNVLSFATVYGLAMQGLGLTRLQTNLLPHEIRLERTIRAKKPRAVAAAAALLLGLTATTVGYALQYRAVAGPDVTKALKDCEETDKKVTEWENRCKQKDEKIRQDENAVKNIIAGQDERLNWIVLNRFTNDCLPMPALRLEGKIKPKSLEKGKCVLIDKHGTPHDVTLDRSTCAVVHRKLVDVNDLKDNQEVVFLSQTDAGAKLYWDDPKSKARQAYLSHWERQAGSKSALDVLSDEEGAEDLIQINLEGVYALYCTDLKTYFGHIVNKKKTYKEGMPHLDHKERPPSGKGWVVELRGYTHHKGRWKFVMDTLVQNLHDRSLPPAKPAAPGAAPAAAPGVKPVDGASAPAKDPYENAIAGRVSHIILYDSKPVQDPDPAKFALIHRTVLHAFVNEQNSAKAGWEPVLPGAFPKHSSRDDGTAPPTADKKGKNAGLQRFEFIVFFIWNEPTPSDDRMETKPAGASQPGRPGVPGAPPPGQPPPAQPAQPAAPQDVKGLRNAPVD